MQSPTANRTPQAAVDPMFLERWSPRAFSARAISDEDLASTFEAARWAPSCFNAQPWRFVYANGAVAEHELLNSLLVEGNRVWAHKAPVLGIVFARRHFEHNGRPNRWASFDCGAASMSLTLQANRLGLVTHFMGGFDEAGCYAALGVNAESHEALAAFAMGYPGDASELPENLREREAPSTRKPLSEVAMLARSEGSR